ncbi:MAG TPA: bifunctional hydroxymethylpyrimidine kinase/phosphomethylpyrimidine kinase, partial [Methylophilaceae bacterium]|nr:bifunctional hydroxymethylpyrimidine kinase/phosphomethylpyrimidine kinase [Methylophilaceae bacterium]
CCQGSVREVRIGTHERGTEVINTMYGRDGLERAYNWERLPGSYHGSGCTLTSAIAACMAHGLSLEEAVGEAQEYTWQTLKAGFRPGMGQYIPDRLFWAREEEDDGEKN